MAGNADALSVVLGCAQPTLDQRVDPGPRLSASEGAPSVGTGAPQSWSQSCPTLLGGELGPDPDAQHRCRRGNSLAICTRF